MTDKIIRLDVPATSPFRGKRSRPKAHFAPLIIRIAFCNSDFSNVTDKMSPRWITCKACKLQFLDQN